MRPLLDLERQLWEQGLKYVAGIDEVGMGALAGPVVAAAVVFPPDMNLLEIKDSKQLTPLKRESLYPVIQKRALFIGIGKVEVERINQLNNIYTAGLEAMRKAACALKVEPEHLLVDGRQIPHLKIPQSRIVKGDEVNFSIAAASIVAKVYRDNLMKKYSEKYPDYHFARHKGYATAIHVEALKKSGPCEIHRTSYEFIKGICGGFSKTYYIFDRQINKAREIKELDLLDNDLNRRNCEVSRIELKRLKRKMQFKKTIKRKKEGVEYNDS
ncbi:MAG: ribonuclease HII [Candidatus Omnitrophica bacterium]|nr:ribonuclease HII [Candidatus Omnitrophota bacterium]